jgi:hypothetical protein
MMEGSSMRNRTTYSVLCGAAIFWAGGALAQTAYLEGHVFSRETGIPIARAPFVIYENISLGPIPILLAEGVTDANGFYQAEVTTAFPVGIIEVFCRTLEGVVLRGGSSAPLQDGVIRRRDIYLKAPRGLRQCEDPQPGDIPPFRK